MGDTIILSGSIESVIVQMNWVIADLLMLADRQKKCRETQNGERYLDGIPWEKLKETWIAAMDPDMLLDSLESLKRWLAKNDKREDAGVSAENVILDVFDKMLDFQLICGVEQQEDEGQQEEKFVKIIGCEKKMPQGRVSSFYALSLYKYLYEKENLPDEEALYKKHAEYLYEDKNLKNEKKFYRVHIELPYKVKCFLLNKKEPKWTEYGEDKWDWKKNMQNFLRQEKKLGIEYGYFEDWDLDRIARKLPYLHK